jgi:flagellar hook assembly protein FlgD
VVEFRLPGLDAGPHSILVSAADNYAQGVLARRNRSTATIEFEVVGGEEFTLGRAYNFPNPFPPDRGTTFVITGLNEPARVLIKVHTVSGALVRILTVDAAVGQTQVFWDGADARGDRVANGAYTYQVEAQGTTSGRVVRFRGQLAAVR